jgi:Tfp pilus assembly protein PilO
MTEETDDFLKAHAFMIVSIFIIFFVGLALWYAYLSAQPTLLKQERQNYKSSYQYSEAKDTELINYVHDYNDLETQKQKLIAANKTENAKTIQSIAVEQAGIADQIYTDTDLVPDQSKLPDSVQKFLIAHPKGG